MHSSASAYFFRGVDNWSKKSLKKGYNQEENGDGNITAKLF